LIIKAFATAWKYKEYYESSDSVDSIVNNLHISFRQFYRYLDLAYMNPEEVNKILSGKLKININDLFDLARKKQL